MQCIQYIRYKVVCTNLGMATPIYLLLMYHVIFMNTLMFYFLFNLYFCLTSISHLLAYLYSVMVIYLLCYNLFMKHFGAPSVLNVLYK